MGKTIQKVKIKTKPSLSDTLKSLTVGVPMRFYNHDFKVMSVRQAAGKLKPKYDFTVTEKDIADGCIVTRIK